jgi:ribonuclease Z
MSELPGPLKCRETTAGTITAAAAADALATKSNVKLLVLAHISGRYSDEEILLEATKTFPNSWVPIDFEHIVI